MKSSVQSWLARAHVKAGTLATLCMSKARKMLEASAQMGPMIEVDLTVTVQSW